MGLTDFRRPLDEEDVRHCSDDELVTEMAIACRALHLRGLDEGVAGHLTAKSVDRPDSFWVTPFGLDFGEVTADDIVLVDAHGRVRAGSGSVNTSAFLIHSAVHRARPDAGSVAHAHGLYGRTFAALGRLIRPLNQNACAFHEDHALLDEYAGPVLNPADLGRLVEVLGPRKALILQHHGLLTLGRSIAEATWWMIAMERCCQAELLALAAGDALSIPESVAAATAANVGTPEAAVRQYQPIRRRALASLVDSL